MVLNGRIAATMIAVQMGIDQPLELATLQCMPDQSNRLFGMGVIARINQNRVMAIQQQQAV